MNPESLIHSPSAGWFSQYPLLNGLKIAEIRLVIVPWNLLLALLPVFLSGHLLKRYAGKEVGRGWAAWGLFLLWVFLFPNAVYLITEVRQLLDYGPRGAPYNAWPETVWLVPLIFLYALAGWACTVISLSRIRLLFRLRYGPVAGDLAVVLLIPLGSLGCFMGLFYRWNVWELFLHPLPVLKDALCLPFTRPLSINLLLFTLVLYILYGLGEWLFSGRLAARVRAPSPSSGPGSLVE